MKKNILLLLLVTISFISKAQIGITANYGGQNYSSFSVNTNQTTKKISGEIKVFRYYFVEVNGYYNFKNHTYHRFSLGLGIMSNPLRLDINTITMPFMLEMYPLKEAKQFSMIFNVTSFLTNYNYPIPIGYYGSVGVRYSFLKD
jgi:hypothetical protein